MPSDLRHLHLLRHAKSSWDDPALSDRERPLAPRGLKAGAVMADYLADMADPPELVLCSTSARTRETLELVRPGLPDDAEVRFDDAIYGAWWHELLELVRSTAPGISSLMVIGHNPGLEELALELVGGEVTPSVQRLANKYPTGALATLAFGGAWLDLEAGAAELVEFVTPRGLD